MTAPLPIAEVFAFFEDARNLGRITPPWLNFQILNADHIRMCVGAEIDYVIGWMGLPMRWKTMIREYEPPRRFLDEQISGPYASWRHRHTFEQSSAGVVIRDCVDYRLPLGLLGRIAHALIVKRQLLQIFRYRQATIARIFNVPGIAIEQPSVHLR